MYNFVLNYDGAALKICQFITSKCVKHIRFKIKISRTAKAVNFGSKRGCLLRYTCKILASFAKEAHKKKRELPHPLPINLKNTKI